MEKRSIDYRLFTVLAVVAAVVLTERLARATEEELMEIGSNRLAKTLAEHGYSSNFNRSECRIVHPKNEPSVSSIFICGVKVFDGTFNYDIAFGRYGRVIYSYNEVTNND
jgi:hypothetical protein